MLLKGSNYATSVDSREATGGQAREGIHAAGVILELSSMQQGRAGVI